MLELGVRVREAVQGRGGRERDRGTRVLIALTIGGAVGPYAYTGLLLITTGFGLAIGNWFALAVGLLLPLPGILWRIRVEEAELERVLGPPTARVPGQDHAAHPGALVRSDARPGGAGAPPGIALRLRPRARDG